MLDGPFLVRRPQNPGDCGPAHEPRMIDQGEVRMSDAAARPSEPSSLVRMAAGSTPKGNRRRMERLGIEPTLPFMLSHSARLAEPFAPDSLLIGLKSPCDKLNIRPGAHGSVAVNFRANEGPPGDALRKKDLTLSGSGAAGTLMGERDGAPRNAHGRPIAAVPLGPTVRHKERDEAVARARAEKPWLTRPASEMTCD